MKVIVATYTVQKKFVLPPQHEGKEWVIKYNTLFVKEDDEWVDVPFTMIDDDEDIADLMKHPHETEVRDADEDEEEEYNQLNESDDESEEEDE